MRAGRIVLTVIGAILSIVGLGFLAGGGTLIWAHATQRDASGYYNTPIDRLATPTYALTTSVDFGTHASQGDLWVPVHPAGTVRVQSISVTGKPVFIGVGPTSDVNRWLSGVAHEHVMSIAFGPFTTDTQQIDGTRRATAPTGETFWTASVTGRGQQSLVWPTKAGSWTVVVMNAAAG